MKKKEFKQNIEILHLEEDFGLGQDIKIAFWKDPSRAVIFDLLKIVGVTREDDLSEMPEIEREKMNTRYFECASLVLVECDIEGIDFSTAELTEKAFEDERIPWGTFHKALIMYLARLTDEYEVLKNVLRRVKELSGSGNENQNSQESQ